MLCITSPTQLTLGFSWLYLLFILCQCFGSLVIYASLREASVAHISLCPTGHDIQ